MKNVASALALGILLVGCASNPPPQPVTVPLPPPPPSGEPAGFFGLSANDLRESYGAPAFIRKENGAEMWRYDARIVTLFFFFTPRQCPTRPSRRNRSAGRGKTAAAACLAGFARRAPGFLTVPGLIGEPAKIAHNAAGAFRCARDAHIAPMQDQPVMGMQQILVRHHAQQTVFHIARRFAGSQAGAIGNAKDMRVDGNGFFSESDVETTLAVLRPTPGSASSASRSRGTAPPSIRKGFSTKR